MEKQLLFTALCAFLLADCFAQNLGHKNVLSVAGGLSMPAASFGSTNQNGSTSGYAQPGENVNISFEHALNKQFGIIAILCGERNTLNSGTLAQQLDNTNFQTNGFYSGTTPPPPQYVHYPNWGVDKNSWYAESLLAGATLRLPLQKSKLTFIAKATAGVAHITMPKLNALSFNPADTISVSITQNSVSALAPSFLASAGVEYRLGTRLALTITAGYFCTTSATFKNVKETVTTEYGFNAATHTVEAQFPSVSQYWNTTTQKQPIGSINVNAGICIAL